MPSPVVPSAVLLCPQIVPKKVMSCCVSFPEIDLGLGMRKGVPDVPPRRSTNRIRDASCPGEPPGVPAPSHSASAGPERAQITKAEVSMDSNCLLFKAVFAMLCDCLPCGDYMLHCLISSVEVKV